jgi:dipeptidyl aminopeptidase/acylaminoacyl peptidase
VSDVHDCVQTVLHLSSSAHRLIDANRVVIRGGSAGGYTTLSALSPSDPNLHVFAAGTSSYDISDLRKLVELTHKFQSHYVQTLVGGTPDELPEVYRARSPVYSAHNIRCLFWYAPLAPESFVRFLNHSNYQDIAVSDDLIVPPNQAEDMIQVIR